MNFSGGRGFGGTLADGGLFPDGGTPQYYAANLTPSDAGLAAYSVDQIVSALRTGRNRDGQALAPVMPYSIYSALTDVDVESIALYLKSLPAVEKTIPKNTAAAPLSPVPALLTTGIPKTGLASSDPNFAAANHGRYLTILACLDCHTPRDAMNRRQLDRAFAGGRSFGPFLKSSNLTPSRDGGIGTYSVANFSDVLTTGMRNGKPLCPTMPAGPSGYGKLSQEDINSMGHYLLSIPALDGGPYGSTNKDGGC